METIRSASNPALKRVRAVGAGRHPDIVLLEGDRLLDEVIALGLTPELVLVSDDRGERAQELEEAGLAVRTVAEDLFAGLSRLDTPPGVLALVPAPTSTDLRHSSLGPDALLVVVAGVQDPGNLGALARSAEAAGAAALVLLAGGCSPWNEKAMRGSMGSLLRLSVIQSSDARETARELAELGFRMVRAETRGGSDPGRFDWSGRVALWLSSETGALPEVGLPFEGVSIPMAGAAESLNVTAAAAVLLFAAGRTGGGVA